MMKYTIITSLFILQSCGPISISAAGSFSYGENQTSSLDVKSKSRHAVINQSTPFTEQTLIEDKKTSVE